MPMIRDTALCAAMLTSALGARSAEACGGFFCATTPVVQTGEGIVFGVDHDRGTIDVTIRIQYQGAAPEFAWVLPLQAEPSAIEVGSELLFQALDDATVPRFRLELDDRGQCFGGRASGGVADASVSVAFDGGAAPGGVEVLREAPVGPYDSVVLRSTNPELLRSWLVEAGYQVTEAMMEAAVPYVARGDVLLALKLRNDSGVGEVQPIALRMPSTEACVPLRLTAIAAADDMEVTAWVLSNRGRAIPSNFLHVTPNLARLDWLSGAGNYRQLLAEAIDEAGGHAFTTEYAGATPPPGWRLEREPDLSPLVTAGDLAAVIDRLRPTNLNQRAEVQALLRSRFDAALREAGLVPVDYWRCPECYRERALAIPADGAALAEQLEERVLAPDRRARALLGAFRYTTRLTTILSADEMSLDPIFDERPELPDVSNEHVATLTRQCSGGEIQWQTLRLPDGRSLTLDPLDVTRVIANGSLPAAERVDDLMTGRTVIDNRARIDEGLPTARRDVACGCRGTGGPGELGLAALGLAALGLVARRRRR